MNSRTLRRRCQARLRTLPMPNPFDLEAFCALLSAQRRRPIILEARPNMGNPAGVWMGGSSIDVIFYDADTTPLHQEHIILHELSHLLCGHRAHVVADSGFTGVALSTMSREYVVTALRRSAAYSDVEEQEAELLASLIAERANRHRKTIVVSPVSASATIDRLTAVLEEGIEQQ